MKQPAWESMPVLDVRALSIEQAEALAISHDSLSVQGLESLANLNSDPVRCQIDKAISETLGIPDFAFIRQLLDREPGMNAVDIVPRTIRIQAHAEDDEDDGQGSLSISELD